MRQQHYHSPGTAWGESRMTVAWTRWSSACRAGRYVVFAVGTLSVMLPACDAVVDDFGDLIPVEA